MKGSAGGAAAGRRTPAAPNGPADLAGLAMHLQGTVGNELTGRLLGGALIQPKLRIGSIDDPAEREADRVADQVMRMPDPGPAAPATDAPVAPSGGGTSVVRRMCDACADEIRPEVDEDQPRPIRRQPAAPSITPAVAGSGGPAAPPIVAQALATPGQPLDPATRSFFEPRFGHHYRNVRLQADTSGNIPADLMIGSAEHQNERNADQVVGSVMQVQQPVSGKNSNSQTRLDLSHVRVHSDSAAAESAKAVRASAYTFGNDIVFGAGAYRPATSAGRRLIAHELAHTLQQNGTATPYIARTPEDWLIGSPNVAAMSYTELLGEIDELTQWLDRQIESSDRTARIEEALTILRREAARREAQTRQDRRRSGRRRRRGQEPAEDTQLPVRRPRVLVEMSSVAYQDPQEIRAEFDLIMQWLARDDISASERAILQSERESLEPLLQQERVRVTAERHAARLQTALTSGEQDIGRAFETSARAIQGLVADSQNPEIFYLYQDNERISISREQAQRLRADILNQLQSAHRAISLSVDYYWNRYQSQREINEDTFLIDDIAALIGGVRDPGEELGRRREQALADLRVLEDHARAGRFSEAAALLAPLERNSQVIRALSRAFYEGLIEGAETSVTVLEFTRDASFAIAGSIAAVVAAPVVAGAAAGAGLTGVSAGAATTLGTGLVVGTGTAAVRGTSAVAGHVLAGSSREEISAAFRDEALRGFREGFLSGAAGGAARVLGPALGVGIAGVSAQVARRVAAGAIVDGTSGMLDVLLNGGSIEDAVAAGVRSAALSIPGSIVGGARNQLLRELGGSLTAGATAYLGAVAAGVPPEDALRSAGLAVTSNLLLSRASHGAEADAALEARGRRVGERVRGSASEGASPSVPPAVPVTPVRAEEPATPVRAEEPAVPARIEEAEGAAAVPARAGSELPGPEDVDQMLAGARSETPPWQIPTEREARVTPDVGVSGDGTTHPSPRPTFLQRQRAAALRRQAQGLEDQASTLERRAAEIERTRPEGAARARERQQLLREQADRLRAEAEEFSSGSRSATEGLPSAEEIDELFSSASPESPIIRVPLRSVERTPDQLPRLIRPLLRSRSGNRVVFRVEGGGSRSLASIGSDGQVTITQGSTIHLNFGSPERAVEFLRGRGPGARLVMFEVGEDWVRAARSAAIPEHQTRPLAGRQPRLVDVTYADDQLEIPAQLTGELQDAIIHGSGRVVHVVE